MYVGSWQLGALVTFVCNTHDPSTGAATDADSVPTYRVYEDETGTPLLTGSMALLDGSNTAGFYSEQITASSGNGFEGGKSYSVYISATVGGITATISRYFQIGAGVDVQYWRGSIPNTLQSGRVDTYRGADAAGLALPVAKLTAQAAAVLQLVVGSGSSTTTVKFSSVEGAAPSSVDDFYNGRVIIFTSGALAGQATSITDYTGSTTTATVVGMTGTPANTVTAVVV